MMIVGGIGCTYVGIGTGADIEIDGGSSEVFFDFQLRYSAVVRTLAR